MTGVAKNYSTFTTASNADSSFETTPNATQSGSATTGIVVVPQDGVVVPSTGESQSPISLQTLAMILGVVGVQAMGIGGLLTGGVYINRRGGSDALQAICIITGIFSVLSLASKKLQGEFLAAVASIGILSSIMFGGSFYRREDTTSIPFPFVATAASGAGLALIAIILGCFASKNRSSENASAAVASGIFGGSTIDSNTPLVRDAETTSTPR